MRNPILISLIVSMFFAFTSCSREDNEVEIPENKEEKIEHTVSNKKKAHQYGGWYCPDNFGFVPVDIQKLDQVPAISGRLPSKAELEANMSLIEIDTIKYTDAKALDMKLPRVAKTYAAGKSTSELIIVIQAIVVSGDTIVGYRFPNGGNGSAYLSEVSFLSEEELAGLGSQPFFYSTSLIKASKEEIWKVMTQSDYFKSLARKFNEPAFNSSFWTLDSPVRLKSNTKTEQAKGYMGMVFGNAYLEINYNRNGFHYSEKLLMIENHEEKTTEFFFASGPFPEGFEKQESKWERWVAEIQKNSEMY